MIFLQGLLRAEYFVWWVVVPPMYNGIQISLSVGQGLSIVEV